jgi:hypothetical protein
MKNRPRQRQLIAFYLAYKERNPTFLSLLRFNARGYFRLLFLAAIIIAIEWAFTGWIIGSFFVCFLLGAFCRDIGLYLRTCRTWPLVREIVDWNKVAQKEAELKSQSIDNPKIP